MLLLYNGFDSSTGWREAHLYARRPDVLDYLTSGLCRCRLPAYDLFLDWHRLPANFSDTLYQFRNISVCDVNHHHDVSIWEENNACRRLPLPADWPMGRPGCTPEETPISGESARALPTPLISGSWLVRHFLTYRRPAPPFGPSRQRIFYPLMATTLLPHLQDRLLLLRVRVRGFSCLFYRDRRTLDMLSSTPAGFNGAAVFC